MVKLAAVIYRHSIIIIAVISFYNTELQLNLGMEVTYAVISFITLAQGQIL
jgi:hypothetical protein